MSGAFLLLDLARNARVDLNDELEEKVECARGAVEAGEITNRRTDRQTYISHII